MAHPLVDQLRFTRAEWLRGLRGVHEGEALRRFEPMNSIGWIVGHLAWQEQRYWLTRRTGATPHPELNTLVANGAPASTPSLKAMLDAWREITGAIDPWLDGLTTADLAADLPGTPPRLVGDSIHRVTYHYWFHVGEIQAIRQLLGHRRLPQFVGALEADARYRPE
ncbi:MAG: DinB family protein [Candidatus Limnocylindrales bacterium]